MTTLKFGTSGLRGLVSDLAGAPAYRHVRAFCDVMKEDGAGAAQQAVLVARDLRSSSPTIAQTCLDAIRDAGLLPIDCGEVPTPALAMAAGAHAAPAIMVTGSHIPDDRNGLKFYRPQGEIDKGDEQRILAWHDRLIVTAATKQTASPATYDAAEPYMRRYVDFFEPRALQGLHVGIYQHSSVGRDIIVEVLKRLGAETHPLGRAEHFIPVDTEALRPEDEQLARDWAGETRLDAIVSTDGDADRPLVADSQGRFLRGDLVGALTAMALGADTIVTPVTSNSALERIGHFSRVLRTRVGSPYVISGMSDARQAGAKVIIGFEANGGVLLGSEVERDGRRLAALVTRDAMLPILACLSLAQSEKTPISVLAERAGFSAALSGRLQNIPQHRTAELIRALSQKDGSHDADLFVSRGGIARMDSSDGLRITLGLGSTVHFRASGNAPELRVYVEAPDRASAETLLADGLAFAEIATR